MNYCQKYIDEIRKVIEILPDIEKLKGKSILITGCNGLICSAVCDILIFANILMNMDIHLFLASRSAESTEKRFGKYFREKWLEHIPYDALQPVDFDFKADYIIHGASNAHPDAYSREPVETLLANVRGVEELLKYAVKSGTERFLYISSSEVYGRKENSLPYKENDYGYLDILNPRACYPSGKRAAETLCVAYQAEYGTETVIVRPGHIYGSTMTARDTRATAQFARDVLDSKDIVMKSAGTQLRSYCYAPDCASAIITVLLKGNAGEAYNISNRNSVVSIRQIAEEFADAGNCKVIFESATDREQKSYNLMDNSSLDAEKLENLGWRALFDCRNGVRNMIEIMKEN